jgi:TrmH family RNA methyltransferase
MTLSNADIKRLKSLAVKKYRDESGLFAVEGAKMVEEALRSGFAVECVVRRDEVGEAVMARISALSSPSPALAVLRQPEDLVLDATRIPAKGLLLALDSIRDPGNLGTILRIADWFGIDAVYASPDTVDVFNPKVVQATMGAIFRVRFHYTDIPALCRAAVAAGGEVYGTFLNGKNLYDKTLSNGSDAPAIIVIGNESNGISPAVAACVTDRLFIPPYPADDPGSESLNAAVATAVTVAEFRRRAL